MNDRPDAPRRESGTPPGAAPARPLSRGLALGALCGLFAALVLGLVDGAQAWMRGSPGSALTPLLSVCLYAPAGVLVGLVLGGITGGVLALLPVDPPSLAATLRRRPQIDQDLAAGLIAGAVALSGMVVLVHLYGTTAAAGMANRRLASLSTALVAGGAVVLSGALFFPLFHVARKLTRQIPRGATALVLVLFMLAGLGAVGLVLGSLDWRVLHFGPGLMMLALVGLTAILIRVQLRRGAEGWQRLSGLALALILGGGLGMTAPAVGRNAAAVDAAQAEGWFLSGLVSLARGLSDRDGDGYARLFQGGDCDDRDPAVHPGATDVPGNGIDENCQGGDAVVANPSRRAGPRPRSGKPAFPGNLLLVCIDTLRADKLGAAGHRGGLTPTLDRLAAESVLFSQVFAQGPNTPQSFPSIFTSRYPSRVPFKNTFTGYPELRPEAVTFFEVLKRSGVSTSAVTSHFYFTEKRGIVRGVEGWDNRDAENLKDSNKDVASPRIVPRAIEKLRALAAEKRRFALFVHLFEPHSTYVTHPGFPITERGVKGLQQKYDFEIKFADLWLGKLLDGLRAAGLEKNTAVIVFGDHAEAFGEHGLYFHGQTLYNECLHVPLLVRLPGTAPRVVRERVALLDLAPTVLELLGSPVPPSFQGLSLVPLLRGEKGPADRRIGAVLLAYPAWPKAQQAMWSGRYKAIYRVTENRFEAYDLETDPGEQKDLRASQPATAARLREELTRFAEQELQ